MKRCPMCAEDCQTAAVICPHCRHAFTEAETLAAQSSDRGHRVFIWLLGLFVLAFVLSAIDVGAMGDWFDGVAERAGEQPQ